MSDRQQQLENIRKCSEKLRKLSSLYDKMRVLAEKETATDDFISITETTGLMIIDEVGKVCAVTEGLIILDEVEKVCAATTIPKDNQ